IPGRAVLTRWDRAASRFQTYSDADGLPAFNAPSSFYEDARQVLFITLRDGGMARYDGRRFQLLSRDDGAPRGNIGGAVANRAGHLWCWASSGVFRIDDLSAPRLEPLLIVPVGQLHVGPIGALVEDARGSLYLASAEGVARIDHASIARGPANL